MTHLYIYTNLELHITGMLYIYRLWLNLPGRELPYKMREPPLALRPLLLHHLRARSHSRTCRCTSVTCEGAHAHWPPKDLNLTWHMHAIGLRPTDCSTGDYAALSVTIDPIG